jgi:hypothetical protein
MVVDEFLALEIQFGHGVVLGRVVTAIMPGISAILAGHLKCFVVLS